MAEHNTTKIPILWDPHANYKAVTKLGFDGPPPSFFENRFIVDRKAKLQDT
jgi:hypothetical protein